MRVSHAPWLGPYVTRGEDWRETTQRLLVLTDQQNLPRFHNKLANLTVKVARSIRRLIIRLAYLRRLWLPPPGCINREQCINTASSAALNQLA